MTGDKNKIFLVVLAAGVVCSSAHGQEAVAAPDQWQLSVTPYFWAAGMDGHVTANGRRTGVDVSFSEIFDALDCGALVHIEARKEKWGLFVDPIYMNLGDSQDLTLITPENVVLTPNAKVDLTMWIVEYGGFYQVAQWCPSDDSKKTIKLDALAGGRYWDIEQNVTIDSQSSKVDENWTDPFIGVRLIAPVNDWLLFHLRADIGGFSITNEASEQTWNVIVGPAIRLSDRMDLTAGYRWLNIDREPTSNSEGDVTLKGPIVGLVIRL